MTIQPTPRIVRLSDLPPLACPCGFARRAFTDLPDAPASVHLTQILDDARAHYHRHHTEIYYILSIDTSAGDASSAAIELDQIRQSLSVGDCVLLPPGTRHRAIGKMTILNIVIPPFDPADEFFD